MKQIKFIGLLLFLLGLTIFTAITFTGSYTLTKDTFNNLVKERGFKNELFIENTNANIVGKTYSSQFSLASDLVDVLNEANEKMKAENQWDKVIWDKPQNLAYSLIKPSGTTPANQETGLYFFLTFGLAIIGGLAYILPDVVLLGPAGIKNNNIYKSSVTNGGLIGILTAVYLVTFYILLYFFPSTLINQVYLVDPISMSLSGNPASQWFLYGFLYCVVMTVMAIRMYIKYRHNAYQVVRTTVVLFFQIAFAFLIPEMLVRFNMPYFDFKNAWPLDYDFFFDWNINSLIDSGNIGIFMLVWGITLTLIIVPIMVYFFGKRWYCSWVCGCGGLAETLGDPYRQLSDKSLKAWKIERYLIHGILVLAIIMTVATLATYFTGVDQLLGIKTYDLQFYYGFLVGSIFSGVIGTGFYPVMGSRVWCRFGCPLAAYMGLVQKFKSRFRITTNGGQCISCGNCSTYCEQGIDVRAYAQKGQNIVRASCVGCGVCAAVCPRGVLKLENGPTDKRTEVSPVTLGNDVDLLNMLKK